MLILKAAEEAARENGGALPGAPWVIDHSYVGTEETVALMKKLNLIPSVLSWWRQGVLREFSTTGAWGASANREGQAGFLPEMGSAMVYMYGADRLTDN